MGNGGSKSSSSRHSFPSGDYYRGGDGYVAPSYTQQDYSGYHQGDGGYYNPGYAAPHPPPSSAQGTPRARLDRRYTMIADHYDSIEQVTEALASGGLESSNLIVGIDFTKSNEWTGKHSFHGKSLHHLGSMPNPYEQAISIIGRTLSKFDDDNFIPCFGFGDASTHDNNVFAFFPDERPCDGFAEALTRYRELVPHLRLAGPTSFAPIIEMAMTIVEQSGGQYHVLLIIADGQVTRSVNMTHGQLSPQEQDTVNAIVRASELPLSIILVGVGDGPWDMMKEFDDNIPARAFDNFQFVNFTEIMSKNTQPSKKEATFALKALMEIPLQYKATLELGILGRRRALSTARVPLPPPSGSYHAYSHSRGPNRQKNSMSSQQSSTSTYPHIYDKYNSSEFQQSSPSYNSSGYDQYNPREFQQSSSAATSAPYSQQPNMNASRNTPSSPWEDNQVCPICLTNPKDMAFGCGHLTCSTCAQALETCPICRRPIQQRIKLY